jgi:type IV secretion system protein VirB10
VGAAAGAAAGLAGVLLTRGPDAVLAKGTSVEMVIDRPIQYDETDLDFSNAPAHQNVGEGGGPLPSKKSQNSTTRRFPL